MSCQPEIVGSGESWGYWCPECGSGVERIGDRTTARQGAQQHVRQRVEARRKVMER